MHLPIRGFQYAVPFISSSTMRVWDLTVRSLCRNHLLAEHRELHAIWSIIINEKKGYSKHPEVMRWRGKLGALWARHELQKREMMRRGYSHRSELDLRSVPRAHRGKVQDTRLESVRRQERNLREKGCDCDCGRRSDPVSPRKSR